MEQSCAHGTHYHKPTKRLAWALGLTLSFMSIEMYSGYLANATVLIADAWHMLNDSASLAIALFVPALLKVKTTEKKAEATASLICSILLILPCIVIINKITEKWVLQTPPEPHILTIVAILGLIVNLICFALIHSQDSNQHLSIKGAKWHIAGDILGSIIAMVAGLISLASTSASIWADIVGGVIILAILVYGIVNLMNQSLKNLRT